MKLSQVYRKAIQLLNDYGWTRGTVSDRDTNAMCLFGACARADLDIKPDNGKLTEYRAKYDKYIKQVVPGGQDGVGYNDGTAAAKEQIQEILFLAAERAEAAGE